MKEMKGCGRSELHKVSSKRKKGRKGTSSRSKKGRLYYGGLGRP